MKPHGILLKGRLVGNRYCEAGDGKGYSHRRL